MDAPIAPASTATIRTGADLIAGAAALPSARALTAGIVVFGLARLLVGSWSVADLVAVVVTVALAGPVEWVIHRHLFHAPSRSRRQQWLRLGRAHEAHHEEPDRLDLLALDRWGAAVLVVAGAAVAVLTYLVVATSVVTIADVVPLGPWSIDGGVRALAGPIDGPALTAAATAAVLLARYETVHLMAHSRYRPRTARGRRLVAHHLRHHFRNPNRCFGVTSMMVDRAVGTA
ncbi:MAG: sterol desaturase family protein [Acidimicrobiales bacterium]